MKLASKFAILTFGLTAFSAAQAAPVDDMIANAKKNAYVGASGSLFTDPSVLGVSALAGAKLHENLAAEARLGLGLGDDNGVEIDSYLALLAKGILPIDDKLSVYGVAGLARVAYSVDFWRHSGSVSESGITLGVGAEYVLSSELSVTGEFLMLPEVEALSVGANYKF